MGSPAGKRKWEPLEENAEPSISYKARKAKHDSADSDSISTSAFKVNPKSRSAPNSTEEAKPIKASSSAGAQDKDVQNNLWNFALQKLSSKEKEAIQQINLDPKLEIVEQLRDVVQQKREQCLKKRWKFNLQGQAIILRDLAEKIIFGLNKFKEIGDVVVTFDPFHAALPWAGVRFLLQVRMDPSLT